MVLANLLALLALIWRPSAERPVLRDKKRPAVLGTTRGMRPSLAPITGKEPTIRPSEEEQYVGGSKYDAGGLSIFPMPTIDTSRRPINRGKYIPAQLGTRDGMRPSMGYDDYKQMGGRPLNFRRVREEEEVGLDGGRQLDEATPGDTRVVTKGDQNQYERISRALTAAKKAGKIAGYEGTVFNRSKGKSLLSLTPRHTNLRAKRRKVAKMIKDFDLNSTILLKKACVRRCPVQKKPLNKSESDRKKTTLIFTRSDKRESLLCVVTNQADDLLQSKREITNNV